MREGQAVAANFGLASNGFRHKFAINMHIMQRQTFDILHDAAFRNIIERAVLKPNVGDGRLLETL